MEEYADAEWMLCANNITKNGHNFINYLHMHAACSLNFCSYFALYLLQRLHPRNPQLYELDPD